MRVGRLRRRGIVLAVLVFMGGGETGVLGDDDGAEVVRVGRDADRAGESFKSVGQAAFIPDMEFVFAIGDGGHRDGSGLVGHGVVGRVDRHYNRTHFRMDIAEQKADPGMVEADGVSGSRFVEAKIKALAIEKREDIVEERVAIRKINYGTDAHDG